MRRKYFFTPDMDERIRKAYREIQPAAGHYPTVKKIAALLGMPTWAISRRAREIGAYEPRVKEPEWTEAEIRILEKNAHKRPEVIRLHLRKAGHTRTVTAIILKRKRLRLLLNLNGYTSRQLAKALGVGCSKTVARWIEQGLLKASRRGTERTEAQGGDMWHIKERYIRKFLIEHIGLVDIRKVDKFWFVDILVNGNRSDAA